MTTGYIQGLRIPPATVWLPPRPFESGLSPDTLFRAGRRLLFIFTSSVASRAWVNNYGWSTNH